MHSGLGVVVFGEAEKIDALAGGSEWVILEYLAFAGTNRVLVTVGKAGMGVQVAVVKLIRDWA